MTVRLDGSKRVVSGRGNGPIDSFVAALAGLGRCDEALSHLDRSESLQGQRKEIDRARKACKHQDEGDEG